MFEIVAVLEVYASLIVAISVVAALYFARTYIRELRERDRILQSMELIKNTIMRMSFPYFSLQHITPEEFAAYGTGDEEKQERRNAILEYINAMEYISVLIEERIASERIIREIFREEFVKGFDACVLHISMIREKDKNPRLYKSFESLAHAWRVGE